MVIAKISAGLMLIDIKSKVPFGMRKSGIDDDSGIRGLVAGGY
jgi:hypothetical protein